MHYMGVYPLPLPPGNNALKVDNTAMSHQPTVRINRHGYLTYRPQTTVTLNHMAKNNLSPNLCCWAHVHVCTCVEHMCTCVKPWNWTPIQSKRSGGFSYVLLRREIHGLISLISFEIGWLIDKSINNSRTECKMKNHAFLHHNLLAKSTAWSHKLYTKSVHIMWSHRDSVNFQKSPHISGIFSSSLLLLLSVQKIYTFMGLGLGIVLW